MKLLFLLFLLCAFFLCTSSQRTILSRCFDLLGRQACVMVNETSCQYANIHVSLDGNTAYGPTQIGIPAAAQRIMRQQEKESRDGKQKWPVTICWDMEDANYQPCITIKSFVQSNPYGRTSEGNNVTICLDVSVNFGFFGRQTIELGCVELQDCDFLKCGPFPSCSGRGSCTNFGCNCAGASRGPQCDVVNTGICNQVGASPNNTLCHSFYQRSCRDLFLTATYSGTRGDGSVINKFSYANIPQRTSRECFANYHRPGCEACVFLESIAPVLKSEGETFDLLSACPVLYINCNKFDIYGDPLVCQDYKVNGGLCLLAPSAAQPPVMTAQSSQPVDDVPYAPYAERDTQQQSSKLGFIIVIGLLLVFCVIALVLWLAKRRESARETPSVAFQRLNEEETNDELELEPVLEADQ